jgi:hypothetical protein
MILMIDLSKSWIACDLARLHLPAFRNGPARKLLEIRRLAVPNRPMLAAAAEQIHEPSFVIAGE